ncbi:MAG TPA: T9SS type A sorting domain-containing protein [Candidatus Kryptonia bacterium]
MTCHSENRGHAGVAIFRRSFEPIIAALVIATFSIVKTDAQAGKSYHDTARFTPSLASADSFMIVLFPDIQNMVQYDHARWESMPNWVRDNNSNRNIKAVIGLGDNINEPVDSELNEAVKGWNVIDSTGLPYVVCIGNHDYDSLNSSGSRADTKFNKLFGPSHYGGKYWFGGACPDSTQNYYITFSIQNQQYLILALEFFPRKSVLSWADSVLDCHPEAEVILATHAYLEDQENRISFEYGPQAYKLDNSSNSGDSLWENFIRKNRNIGLVVCGHMVEESYNLEDMVSPDLDGFNVDQLVADYQNFPLNPNGYGLGDGNGDGCMVILEYHPRDSISVNSFSALPVGAAPTPGECVMPWPGSTTSTRIGRNGDAVPRSCSLYQNYPNPFNPSTVITYQLPANCFVTLELIDVLGREIKTLVNEHQDAGKHVVSFNGTNLPSGVYFYRLSAGSLTGQAGTFIETKKLLLMK